MHRPPTMHYHCSVYGTPFSFFLSFFPCYFWFWLWFSSFPCSSSAASFTRSLVPFPLPLSKQDTYNSSWWSSSCGGGGRRGKGKGSRPRCLEWTSRTSRTAGRPGSFGGRSPISSTSYRRRKRGDLYRRSCGWCRWQGRWEEIIIIIIEV